MINVPGPLPIKMPVIYVAFRWIDTAIFFPNANLGEIGLPLSGMVKIAKSQPLKVVGRGGGNVSVGVSTYVNLEF